MHIPNESTSEAVQIYHKLLFDATNNVLVELQNTLHYQTPAGQLISSSPWIRKHSGGSLSKRGRMPRNAESLCTKLISEVVKWDAMESKPEQARVSSSNYALGTTLTETLSSAERLDAVLGTEIHLMEIEWKRQYEMMEVSVKNQLADEILIDLLEDTANAAKKVQRKKTISTMRTHGM
jgi:hypothetical protein